MKREQLQSIVKEQLRIKTQAGFSLVEVILATAVFGLLVTALVGAYLYGQEATALAGSRARAVMLAEEGLEATRNIRDAGFSNLTDGTYGLSTSGNQWGFSGSSDTNDIFTRQVTISAIDSKRKQIACTVTWQQNPQRTGSVSAATYLTNWIAAAGGGAPPASCNDFVQSVGFSAGTCRANVIQCTNNGEVYLPLGDPFCTGGPSVDTCCALP